MSTYPFRTNKKATTVLQNLARRKAPVRMSHSFRGMLFTQDLLLESLESDQAYFKISHSCLAASLGDRIYLHSPTDDEMLSARVMEIDIQVGRLVLGDFTDVGRPWATRSHERVRPCKPIRVILRCDTCSLPTFLENISLVGVGLLAYKPAERGLEPRVGNPVKIEFELPILKGRLTLPGRLVNISYPGARLATIGINTFPNVEQARVLERYVTHRQAEIVDELEQAFKADLEPRSVQELYF